jgi:hypothetical protein
MRLWEMRGYDISDSCCIVLLEISVEVKFENLRSAVPILHSRQLGRHTHPEIAC